MDPPSTPAAATAKPPPAKSVLTPEATQRIEESRLKAKAIRDQRDAELRAAGKIPSLERTSSGIIATDNVRLTRSQKRSFSAVANDPNISPGSNAPRVTNNRDGRVQTSSDRAIAPAPKFAKYVEYNMSAMTDTKGGFLSTEDDPHNQVLGSMAVARAKAIADEQRPKHMTEKEWERLQLIRSLQRRKAGPFEPGISVLADDANQKKCRECQSLEIDYVWEEVFHLCVCSRCKEKLPEKYSLLTKTEAREDYLLTEPELRDESILPHLSRPNPHKSHWHDMMLFLRCQVEEYAFTEKWGSAEALDAEFERREVEKRKRKEAKFKERLADLKKKTRTEAYRRQNAAAKSGTGRPGDFGDQVGGSGKHVHEWGRTVENAEGMTVKTCLECGMEVEELEF